jgi:hypothetical protein
MVILCLQLGAGRHAQADQPKRHRSGAPASRYLAERVGIDRMSGMRFLNSAHLRAGLGATQGLASMQELTPEGLRIVQGLAQNYSIGDDAVIVLLRALVAGNGYQAQFNHPELGGMGQWSQGGMIMIGDMFNQGLKNKVSMLCEELSNRLRNQPLFVPAASQTQSQSQGQGPSGVSFFAPGPNSINWWPADLGVPSATGAQNDMRYACFPATRRLAIQQGGVTRVYDTGEHIIGGFSQQQSGDQSLTFNGQFGLVRVADLPVVSPVTKSDAAPPPPPFAAPASPSPAQPATIATSGANEDIFSHIERLADLRAKNILTDEEFTAKKAELLSRL